MDGRKGKAFRLPRTAFFVRVFYCGFVCDYIRCQDELSPVF